MKDGKGEKESRDLSGAQYFDQGMLSFEDENDEEIEGDQGDDEMHTKSAESKSQNPTAKQEASKAVARRKKKSQLPSDDEPVPKEGYFDGGIKMWKIWQSSGLPLSQWRKWRREHDDEFCLEEEEERIKWQKEFPAINPPPRPHEGQRPPKKVKEKALIRVLPKHMELTREEREAHEATHANFAAWCGPCVMARAHSDPHRTVHEPPQEGAMPVVSMDFCFPEQVEQSEQMPVLVHRCRRTRMTFAHSCQGKSTRAADYSAYIVGAVTKDIDSLGYKRIGLRTDQEPSMTALQDRVKRAREEETVLLKSKVRDSQGNGVVEKAVQDVEGMIRTLKIALELRIKERGMPGTAIIHWLVDY